MPFIELVAQRRSPTPPPGMQPPENAKDWFRIENSVEDDDATDIYVYESIGGWFGMWSEDFIYQLKQVSTSKINLRLNSPGGSVFDGIAIANALRAHPANVTVYVDSLAASIASVIALAGDRVVMMPQSQFMVHNASGGCYGDATEMTKMADLLDKQSLNIAKAYAEHTGRPVSEWQDYMAAETWFTAEEAVAVGLADEVLPMRTAEPEEEPAAASASASMQRTWDLSMYRFAGRENAPAPALTNQVEVTTPPEPDELVVPSNALSAMTSEELTALIRETIRAELAAAEAAAEPPEVPETEDAMDPEETECAAEDAADPEDPEAPAPEDADKKLPPFLQPDEDEEEDPEDETPAEPVDEWASLVDRLTDSPSPSADDVFKSLKEAW
jgi:ATP-dependent Clp endopeptidase proteolytic subunit ClpP